MVKAAGADMQERLQHCCLTNSEISSRKFGTIAGLVKMQVWENNVADLLCRMGPVDKMSVAS
jgi:hypothetical protein